MRWFDSNLRDDRNSALIWLDSYCFFNEKYMKVLQPHSKAVMADSSYGRFRYPPVRENHLYVYVYVMFLNLLYD